MATAHGDTRFRRSTRTTRLSRRLGIAVAALVATDLVGGVLSVLSGVNTWTEAWGSKALLAAPVPMILVQVLLTAVATLAVGRRAAVAAGLLAVACLVSVVSGFFDGGIGNDALSPTLSGYQMLLLAVTATVGVLAARRSVEALRLQEQGEEPA